MRFKSLNESFEKLYQPISEPFSYTEDCIKRLSEALNEAEISDEDKHDSDLIRSMLDKMQGRSNAKFSPEEIAVMDKYGIKRNNNTKNLIVAGRDLSRDIDDPRSYSWGHENNGTPSKINYADRARKLLNRKDSQIFTSPRTADNDQINTHGYNRSNFKSLQDADRYSQDIPMRDKVNDMKNSLRDRKHYQNRIDNADTERENSLAKAKAEYDKKVADAERWYKYSTVDAANSRDYYQKKIDKMLNRTSKNESKSMNESPVYDMSPQYDNRQSFYGKARVDDNGNEKTLYSYNTPVAKIVGNKVELLPKWDFSQTTLRHVKEFLKQNGFEVSSLAQMRRDYL